MPAYKITYKLQVNSTPRLLDQQDLLICGEETEEEAAKYFADFFERSNPSYFRASEIKAIKQ